MIFERLVVNYYKKALLPRRDPDGALYYFSKNDFPELSQDKYFFTGDKGQRLAAFVYYTGEKRYDKLVIFEHGMGCGHESYMTEIRTIVSHGYTVFTYDHTGTKYSEGENIGGFSQSLSDLDRAIGYVRSLPEFAESELTVIGHSWGGFSTMNIAALHPDISRAIAISGFISPKAIQEQVMTGILKIYRKAIYKLECEAFPNYAGYDGRDTLRETKVKTLIIHSRDDGTCLYKNHFEPLYEAVCGNENVEFLALDGKGHYPQFTADAVKYHRECARAYAQKKKKKELSTDGQRSAFCASYDWERMTKQDDGVWDKIFEFIEN